MVSLLWRLGCYFSRSMRSNFVEVITIGRYRSGTALKINKHTKKEIIIMQGKVKFFDKKKGWGFVTDSEGQDHFVHYTSIIMDGFRYLNEDDIVNFELGVGNDDREQAINVQPILTMKMVEDSLKEENLYVKEIKADANTIAMNALGMDKGYMVVDLNNVIQVGEQGMSFLDLAAFAGFDTEGLSE